MAREGVLDNAKYGLIGDTAAVDISGTALTVAIWVKPTAGGDAVAIAKTKASPEAYQYVLSTNPAGGGNWLASLRIHDYNAGGSGEFVVGATGVAPGTWRHICGVKNGTGAGALKVYLSGVEDGSQTSNQSIAATTGPLTIGHYGDFSVVPYYGSMAEACLWNIALTPGEIAALAAGFSPLLIQPANLKGYWPLWGEGSVDPDLSGGESHSTVQGSWAKSETHAPVPSPFAHIPLLGGLSSSGIFVPHTNFTMRGI